MATCAISSRNTHSTPTGAISLRDLSAMRAVRVDRAARRAWVQGGALWADVDRETTAFGLATPGGMVSQTGVAGLTLSGGIGWLRGRHGLSIDNLDAVEIVTADGRLLHADALEHADLFWAVRGGGGNFGVVTCFLFRLHPIPPALMFCSPVYPEADACELIPLWRDFMARAPEQLSSLVDFSTVPDDTAYPAAIRGRRVISLRPYTMGQPTKVRRWSLRFVPTECRWRIPAARCPTVRLVPLRHAISEGPRPVLLEVTLSARTR